jgi:aminobenzoyl-glutamate transport protein
VNPTVPADGRRSVTDRLLALVERGGNALPHPVTLFALLALGVVVMSGVSAGLELMVVHPATGEEVRPVNLLTVAGLHRILTNLVTNFTGFAPLGVVLVALIGIGVAEHSGLIGVALRLLVVSAPRRLLTLMVVFAGVMSNMASEIGYVLLVPLAALIFQAAGRHPVLGLAAAFAGVSGGYSANLLLGTIDPLLAGLSQEAARIVDPEYTVSPAANWYFMIASTPLVTLMGTAVTEWVVARRFPDPVGGGGGERIEPIGVLEKRGLVWALVATLGLTAVVLLGTVPERGFLRDAATGDLLNSPFLKGIVALIFVYGLTAGLAYGIGAGSIRRDEDVIQGMSRSMATLGGYLVLVFFAAQFVAFFNWTQLGLILAVRGADFLGGLNLPAIPLLIGLVVLTAAANLFMGSASAKWALMAPVFVPMFMLLGYSPELTQVAYRIGDSTTNIISPMMSYFALIIALLQTYEPKARIGTLVALMAPYSVVFLAGWSVLLALWLAAGLPIGPGSPLDYRVGS